MGVSNTLKISTIPYLPMALSFGVPWQPVSPWPVSWELPHLFQSTLITHSVNEKDASRWRNSMTCRKVSKMHGLVRNKVSILCLWLVFFLKIYRKIFIYTFFLLLGLRNCKWSESAVILLPKASQKPGPKSGTSQRPCLHKLLLHSINNY